MFRCEGRNVLNVYCHRDYVTAQNLSPQRNLPKKMHHICNFVCGSFKNKRQKTVQ